MARTVAIGIQNFEKYIESKCFYVDKTKFIGEWWKASDDTTVVMRPRRFGKTLTMDMVKTFFSLEYKDKGEKIFGGLEIWQDEEMKALQGTYPVIFLTFAAVKPNSYENLIAQINSLFRGVYSDYDFLLSSDKVKINTKESLKEINEKMSPNLSIKSINVLCGAIFEHYGKRPIIILDEYDTPMLEAYAKGYWEETVEFLRGFFNFTFKTNPYLERALMTGITRISKESIFSDFNHVKLVTMLSDKYADLVYNGLWFTPLREALDAFVDKTQENVTGDVKLKLYKGNIIPVSVTSPYSLYSSAMATFDEDDCYNQADSAGFINLYGLPLKVRALNDKALYKKEGIHFASVD